MFVTFFYKLKDVGIPVSPTSFLRLQKALSLGLIGSLEDFYTAARTVLIKSERYFDLYDQVFAHYFKGAELPEGEAVELDEAARNCSWRSGCGTRRGWLGPWALTSRSSCASPPSN